MCHEIKQEQETVILALGSNKGDRLLCLSSAIKLLSKFIKSIETSPVYESEAHLPSDSPDSWNKPFVNIALSGNTNYLPYQLLREIQKIEVKLGRSFDHKKWSPREIDIDIIAYDSLIMEDEKLTIPHNLMHKRAFVLLPMSDIVPTWKYPVIGKNYGKTPSTMLENISEYDLLKCRKIIQNL